MPHISSCRCFPHHHQVRVNLHVRGVHVFKYLQETCESPTLTQLFRTTEVYLQIWSYQLWFPLFEAVCLGAGWTLLKQQWHLWISPRILVQFCTVMSPLDIITTSEGAIFKPSMSGQTAEALGLLLLNIVYILAHTHTLLIIIMIGWDTWGMRPDKQKPSAGLAQTDFSSCPVCSCVVFLFFCHCCV